MLDRRLIREDPARVRLGLRRRSLPDVVVDEFLDLDARHRAMITTLDSNKSDRNRLSAEFARAKAGGAEALAELRARSTTVGDAIRTLEIDAAALDEQLDQLLSGLPNLLADDVPDGSDESSNVEVRRFLEPTRFGFEPKPHWEIGERLRILDFERGVSLA